jgi:hypothetical protein
MNETLLNMAKQAGEVSTAHGIKDMKVCTNFFIGKGNETRYFRIVQTYHMSTSPAMSEVHEFKEVTVNEYLDYKNEDMNIANEKGYTHLENK